MNLIPKDLIVSVSGIRGIVGQSLTPEVACRFAQALGTYLQGGTVIVSRDSRPSGVMLRNAVIAGLQATKCQVLDIGIAPTPTVGVAVKQFSAKGAIQITASHNPSPWNGLKMFGSDGAVLTAERGQKVKTLFESGEFVFGQWNQIADVRVPPDVGQFHLQKVMACVTPTVISTSGLRVFIDANGGAGGPLATRLLEELGCPYVAEACYADGVFLHEAEPIPAHLQEVAERVRTAECDVGFVLDPDADRLALIDEKGQCISEELTLALAVKLRLSRQAGTVVINMSSSRVNEDLAREVGCECFRTAVGEANVVAGMRAHQAVIGGEGNGGVIDPRIGWVRDPFIGMVLILELMAETGQPLSELVRSLPQYHMLKTKVTVPKEQLASALEKLKSIYTSAEINTVDGLRFDWKDRWVHVRASNTEPIVRIIAEAPTLAECEKLCQETEQGMGLTS
jgi:phosphomannomutase